MENNQFFKSILEESHSFYSTILIFGFTDTEKELLEECVNNMVTQDKAKKLKIIIKVYATEEITDIYGIPYFMAFINFKDISKEDTDSLIEFFNECVEPLPIELKEQYRTEDFSNPIIYTLNFKHDTNKKIPQYFKLIDNIFKNKESLRLLVLSKLKDLEDLGIASSNANRIYRVLQMYKLLIKKGVLNKKMVDELMYPDMVSQRMYYKDIDIIKYVENGNLVYDRKLKVYRLKDLWRS